MSTTNQLDNYGIKPGYRHRGQPASWDDRKWRAQFQQPVYDLARTLMRKERLVSVLDIGSGSAYKLVHTLGDYQTIGSDIQPAFTYLQQQYPARRWFLSDLERPCPIPCVDLVLCSDVIEHLSDPDILLDYVASISDWKKLVISTPNRDKARGPGSMGPPGNPCHAREWIPSELIPYVAQWFAVVDSISMKGSTHAIVCVPS